jgi:hypothetical protein
VTAFVKKVGAALVHDKVPLWLHILTLILTVVVTVVAAPLVNSRFEQQKIRSAFVINSLDQLNVLTSDLAVKISRLNYCVAKSSNNCEQQVADARESLTKLQWKSYELRFVLNRPREQAAIFHFSQKLDAVREVLDLPPSVANSALLLKRMRPFMDSSVELITVIAGRAGLVMPASKDGVS